MAKTKAIVDKEKEDELVIDIDRCGYRIVWFLAWEDEYGAMLGEEQPSDNLDGETAAASQAVLVTKPERDSKGYYWTTKAAAQRALPLAKRAMEEFKGAKPWPEWAKLAQAAGWKAPKGWTP